MEGGERKTALVGGRHRLAFPEGWVVSAAVERGTVVAVEPRDCGFACSVVASVVAGLTTPLRDPIGPALEPLVRPMLLDEHRSEAGNDVRLLLTHLVGDLSVTALQRQLSSPAGTVSVTVTVPTDRWDELWRTAEAVLESVEETS